MKFTAISVLAAASLPTVFGEFFLKEDFNDKVCFCPSDLSQGKSHLWSPTNPFLQRLEQMGAGMEETMDRLY